MPPVGIRIRRPNVLDDDSQHSGEAARRGARSADVRSYSVTFKSV